MSVARVLVFVLASLIAVASRASVLSVTGEGNDVVEYRFSVVDSITRMYLTNSEVLLFAHGDTTVIGEGLRVVSAFGGLNRHCTALQLPMIERDYDVVIDADGYQTRRLSIHADGKRREMVDLGEVGLLRMPRNLKEVTVEATKIKLYYKGDTLIYNADAFLLPDGSMLGDLIKKLDGVSIDRSGQIFCNGRKVESLMLEGRKLFDGSPRVMMENLAAYTVSKVKVYDYTDEQTRFLGYGGNDEKQLTMDIVLKKEFSIGKWLNVDAGYGTCDRYLGRAFGLGFSKTLALSAFFNFNNLSTGDNPTKYDQWNPSKADNSESSYLSGGLAYEYFGNGGKRKVSGDVKVNSDRKTVRSIRERDNYLSDGNTYATMYSNSRARNLQVATRHTLDLLLGRAKLSVSPEFSYSRENNDSEQAGATFDADFGRVSYDSIRQIYSMNAGELIRHLINRNVRLEESRGNSLNASGSASTTVKLPDSERVRHNITLGTSGGYGRNEASRFTNQTLNYGANPVADYDVYAYRRSDPSNWMRAGGRASYEINVDRCHTFSVEYSFGYNRDVNTIDRYLLGRLDELGAAGLGFGTVPADDLLEGKLDPVNSKWQRSVNESHKAIVNARMTWGNNDLDSEGARGLLTAKVAPGLEVLKRSLAYARVGYDTLARRNDVLPSIQAELLYKAAKRSRRQNWYSSVKWRTGNVPVNMLMLINALNNSNPLFVTYGNPNLKNGRINTLSAQLSFSQWGGNDQNHSLSLHHSTYRNSVTNGMVYNPQSGVTTMSYWNVSGNRSFSAAYNGSGTLKRWTGRPVNAIIYSAAVDYEFSRSVMLAQNSTDNWLMPARVMTHNHNVRPSAGVGIVFGGDRHKISLDWAGVFNRFDSDEPQFSPDSRGDMYYKVAAAFTLPGNVKISSTLTVHTRHGYQGDYKRREYIWEASASWHWKKPRLTFFIDGFDMLRQIGSVSVYTDPLGRTQTWSNTLPGYVLLRVRYHLDIARE